MRGLIERAETGPGVVPFAELDASGLNCSSWVPAPRVPLDACIGCLPVDAPIALDREVPLRLTYDAFTDVLTGEVGEPGTSEAVSPGDGVVLFLRREAPDELTAFQIADFLDRGPAPEIKPFLGGPLVEELDAFRSTLAPERPDLASADDVELDALLASGYTEKTTVAPLSDQEARLMRVRLLGRTLGEPVKPDPDETVETSTRRRRAPQVFRDAAVFARLVRDLRARGLDATRFRVGKCFYLVWRMRGLRPDVRFLRHPGGPYDPRIRYKGPEDIAVRQRHWLVAEGNRFDVGPEIQQGLRYAQRYVDDEIIDFVIQRFGEVSDAALERSTTVDYVAFELKKSRRPIAPAEIRDYLAQDPIWAAKLIREDFSEQNIAKAMEELRSLGLVQD